MFREIRIDRCVCYDRTFAELKDAADADALGLDELSRRFGCGSCCGVCRPYLERMLETGETVFHQIIVRTHQSR
jgi:bacterioferritin-associated ferredoxin